MITIQPNKRYWIRQDEFRTDCPFCKDNKKHLYVNTSKNIYYCFKCNATGKFKEEYISLPKKQKQQKNNYHLLPPEKEHINYLKNRGLTSEEILLYLPVTEVNAKDYVFSLYSNPIVGRCINNKEPKYLYLLQNQEEKKLWGSENIKNNQPLIIVEGIFDFFAIKRWYSNVVSTLGKTISHSQFIQLISFKLPEIVVLLDNDVKSVDLNWKRLSVYQHTTFLKVKGGDPWDNRDFDFSSIVVEGNYTSKVVEKLKM